ncbi:hypothetical protein BJX76DRAFT_336164 [Aspergillus varians]
MLDTKSVWFITGALSGLGKSITIAAYESGFQIVATARSVDSLSYLRDEPRVLKLSLDVTSAEQIDTSLTAAVSDEDARHQVETNFWGPARITRSALQIFREVNPTGHGGTIVQICSIGGWIGFPGNAYYHAREPSTLQRSVQIRLAEPTGGGRIWARSV